ncbi:hypothetical protein D9Q98_000877 [Chlorella vulgaris]|uniref:Rhodanese domain-containing protein n=1 Tax=Chlorella vulgaris TaxID=3077 RepID=A0A9D4TZ85_CHLVU|nr:hypothetical protein D9Q98_000877 [Chlorella vulgaris]
MASSVAVLSPARVKALLRGPLAGKTLIVDVRDSDFAGGHIRGALNITTDGFSSDQRIEEVVQRCQGMETVVVHCYLSQQRGPFCAQRLADRLAASSGERPEVCVMAGGWRRFARELQEADLDLVEDYC